MEVPRPTSRLEIMAAMRRIRVSIHLEQGVHLYYIPAHVYLSATSNRQNEPLPVCNHVRVSSPHTKQTIIWQGTDNDSLSLLVRVQGQGDQEEESDTGGLGGWGESHIT